MPAGGNGCKTYPVSLIKHEAILSNTCITRLGNVHPNHLSQLLAWSHLLLSQLLSIHIYLNIILTQSQTLCYLYSFSRSFQVTAKAATALYDKLQVNLRVGKLPEPWQQHFSSLSIIHCTPCKSTKTNELLLNHSSNRKLPSLHLSSFNLLMKSNLPSKRRHFLENTTKLSSVNMVKAQQNQDHP